MAWPFTPTTSYVATTTPSIKASDLNNFQSGINGVYGGTKSLKYLTLDGVGNQANTPTDLLTIKNSAGDTTKIVDLYGYEYNNASRFREDWFQLIGANSQVAAMQNGTGVNAVNNAYTLYAGVGNWNYPYFIGTVAANADLAGVTSQRAILVNSPHMVCRARCKVSVGSLTNATIAVGLNKTSTVPTAGNSGLMAAVQSGVNGGGWTMRTGGVGGAGAVVTNTAIASFAAVQQDIMLVLKGSSRGNSTSLYIDGVLACTQSTVMPIESTAAEAMSFMISITGNAGGAAASVAVGPADVSWTID